MACQEDGERKNSSHKSLGLWSCPREPSRAWGSCLHQPPCPGSQETCPPPIPSPWPQNRAGCVCRAGTAPTDLTEQTQTGSPGTARPGTPASSSYGVGPGTLVPVEEDWHLAPPDISRDSNPSKHTLPQQELREQEQVVKIFPAQDLHLSSQRRLLGHWQGLFSTAELRMLGFRIAHALST